MARPRNLGLTDLPLTTRFKRKPRQPNLKSIRDKAKISVAYYDAENYGVTIKRGVTIVKKAKMPIGKLAMEDAEKTIRSEVSKGTFDNDLIEGYQKIMASRKRKKSK